MLDVVVGRWRIWPHQVKGLIFEVFIGSGQDGRAMGLEKFCVNRNSFAEVIFYCKTLGFCVVRYFFVLVYKCLMELSDAKMEEFCVFICGWCCIMVARRWFCVVENFHGSVTVLVI